MNSCCLRIAAMCTFNFLHCYFKARDVTRYRKGSQFQEYKFSWLENSKVRQWVHIFMAQSNYFNAMCIKFSNLILVDKKFTKIQT